MLNIHYFDVYTFIALLGIIINSYLLFKDYITKLVYFINSIIYIFISLVNFYVSGLLVDELNLVGDSKMFYILIIEIIILIVLPIVYNKKRDN